MLGAFRFDEEFHMAVAYIAPALLTKPIGGLQILVFHLASERRTKFATPIFPAPGASSSIWTG